MSREAAILVNSLETLRGDFDSAFTRAPREATGDSVDFVGVWVGGDPYVVDVAELAAIVHDKPVMSLPGPLREARGLVGLRDVVMPVYDMGMLLGYGDIDDLGWLLIPRDARVALACGRFDGHRRVAVAAVAHDASGALGEIVTIAGVSRPVIRLRPLIEKIESLVQRARARRSR